MMASAPESVDGVAGKSEPSVKERDATDPWTSVPASDDAGKVNGVRRKANSTEPAGVKAPRQDGIAGGSGGNGGGVAGGSGGNGGGGAAGGDGIDCVDGNSRSFSSEDTLTVQGVSKVDAELPTQIQDGHGASRSVTLVRWVVMAVLSLGFLTCLVASKLSILSIAGLLRIYRNATSPQHDQHANASLKSSLSSPPDLLRVGYAGIKIVYGIESCVLWILIVLLVPNVATLILSLLTGACRSDRPWPAWSAVAWGLASSILESLGLVIFALEVMSDSPASLVVWLMNGVFSMPLLFHFIRLCRGRSSSSTSTTTTRRTWKVVLLCLGLVFEVAGIVLAVFVVMDPFGNHRRRIGEVWEIPVSLILISIAWSPYVQKRQLHPRQDQLDRLWRQKRSRQTQDVPSPEEAICIYPELSARWKSSAITCIMRIILIPGFGILYAWATRMINVADLRAGFLNLTPSHPEFDSFIVNLCSSVIGSVLGSMACIMCMQKLAFAVPLILATPVSFTLVLLQGKCLLHVWQNKGIGCDVTLTNAMIYVIVPAAICLVLAQVFSTAVFIFKTQTIVMQKSSHLFWLPGYNGVFLEQLLLLGRKNIQTNEVPNDPVDRARKSHVIICTTMYREAAHEMEQLLRSIKAINRAKQQADRSFEAHIFFDNGTRGTRLTEFALQLACIVKTTLDVESSQCTKVMMPYGIRLTWRLETDDKEKQSMALFIHLKDNLKVKNKKRWSQVMYMSYVIDFFLRERDSATLDNTFILTTDADVKFTPESVEALLDLMMRDDNVGAVCSRTFPLGSGPVYWFQIFDYAVGHWLQKASNHVLGSVLCCPGCFSVYRLEAVRDILPTYGSQVEKASEFLTKDMGEDRWLCTLMVQSGWRLEYCAAASNSTYCPEEFDEFFKQRRRWIPSTLANQVLLLQEWKTMSYFNKNISFMFMLYQALLLFSTLVNPAVSILVIVGGLQFAWSFDPIVSTILMILITIGYSIVCLYCSQDTQLMIAKVLTCIFAMIMAAVCIGTIAQIVEGETRHPPGPDLTTIAPPLSTRRPPPSTTKKGQLWEVTYFDDGLLQAPTPPSSGGQCTIDLPLSVTTLYLAGLIGIFFVTALMHLPEAYCLLHGAWYLFCLPAGNLFLMIYSICNITDRSWGTREEKKVTGFATSDSLTTNLINVFKKIFFCWKFDKSEVGVTTRSTQTQDDDQEGGASESDEAEQEGGGGPGVAWRPLGLSMRSLSRSRSSMKQKPDAELQFLFAAVTYSKPISVREWLPMSLKDRYSDIFESNGYDDTSFVAGMTDSELKEIGIKTSGHRNAMMQAIRILPDVEIEPCVPKNIDEWLKEIGLTMYTAQFHRSLIISQSNMEILKSMSVKDIKNELGITKRGHLKRLAIAISRLRYPTTTEKQAAETRNELDALRLHNLKAVNSPEYEFWEKLRQEKLQPDSGAFAHDADLKSKLEELRNSTLLVYAVTNVIWIILILTLASKSERLDVLCTNPLGLVFLVIFGSLLCIQFLCMIIHRMSTWMHMIARAPDKCGDPYNATWAFKDSDIRRPEEPLDPEDIEARREREEINQRIIQRFQERVIARHVSFNEQSDERQSLIPPHNVTNRRAAQLTPNYSSVNHA